MALTEQQKIRFFKMNGSGNDFIIVDNRDQRLPRERYQELTRRACRRKLSVGADGFIAIENDPETDFQWQFYNADGSVAEMCGNGARCAARFAYLQEIVDKPVMTFRTLAGVIHAEVIQERVKINATPPHSVKSDLDLQVDGRTLAVDFINTGVPHAVHFVESAMALEDFDVFHWGRALRNHPQFQPAGANANFVFLRDRQHLLVRTYERGVEAETLACGTGTIASALVAAMQHQAVSPVEVETRSGEVLTIYFQQTRDSDGPRFTDVYLEGDAKVVYEADLWDETIRA